MTRESFTNGAVNLFNVIFHLSIGKATMNDPRLWKLRKGYLTEIGGLFKNVVLIQQGFVASLWRGIP